MNPVPNSSVSNPRRPPAHLSVSLRHSERAPETAIPQKPQNINPTAGSSGYQSWFDQSNNQPEIGMRRSGTDEEPPYFLPQEDGMTSASGFTRSVDNRQFPPERMHTIDSSVDDYRSVIDDLTIENRKLKERLRKLEGSSRSSPQLEKDRLFEVKIHGLHPQKRRELEETLRTFAANLESTTTKTPDTKRSAKTSHEPDSGDGSHKPSSTSTWNSNSQPVDSAYASLSNSGPTSTSISNHAGLEQKLESVKNNVTGGNVQSFLHGIPKGLLPKTSIFMTERQRKKAVVRRMEQVFTGNNGVSAGEHSQPMQQQEVSKSATRADRAADGLSSVEGHREAYILPYEMDDSSKPGRLTADASRETELSQHQSSDNSSDESLDQRPTRPLDLDPDRAQIPSDNVDYIRHLGLSTPQFAKEEYSDAAPTDAQGWMPLNLVMGLAQLHIINVTPDFVRTAVEEVSEKFHLSKDGQKVRWRGGTEGTRLSSDSGTSSARSRSPHASFDGSNKKRRKVNIGRFAAAPIDIMHPTSRGNTIKSNIFNYRPLFHHQRSSDEDMSSFDESDSILEPNMGFDSDPGRVRQRRLDDSNTTPSSHEQGRGNKGPIVFYNGATFCTDLSGDRGNIDVPRHVSLVKQDDDHHHLRDAIGNTGKRPHPSSRSHSSSHITFRPFKKYLRDPKAIESQEPQVLSRQDAMELDFPLGWATDRSNQDRPPRKFSASGLGGTTPADHFTAKVETRRTILDGRTRAKLSRFSAPSPAARRFVHNIPKAFLSIFQESRRKNFSDSVPSESGHELPVKIEFISTKFSHLEPSPLPAPLYYNTASTSSSSEDDSDCRSSSSPPSELHIGQYLKYRARSFSPLTDDLYRPSQAQDLIWTAYGGKEAEGSNSKDESDIDMLSNVRNSDSCKRGSRVAKAGASTLSGNGGSGYSSSDSLDVERDEDTD